MRVSSTPPGGDMFAPCQPLSQQSSDAMLEWAAADKLPAGQLWTLQPLSDPAEGPGVDMKQNKDDMTAMETFSSQTELIMEVAVESAVCVLQRRGRENDRVRRESYFSVHGGRV